MFKKIAVIVAGFIFIIIAASVVVPYFIKAGEFRTMVAEQIESMTGYRVAIKGDLSIQLFPFARISAEDVVISSPLHEKHPIASVAHMDMGLKIFPLIGGNILIKHFTLEAPVVKLIKSPSGNNWDIPSATVAGTVDNRYTKNTGQNKLNLSFSGVTIKKGSVYFENTADGTKLAVAKLDVSANMDSADEPLKLSAKADWNNAPVKLDLTMNSLKAILNYKPAEIKLSVDSSPLKLVLDGVSNNLEYNGAIELSTPSIADLQGWLLGTPAGSEARSLKLKGNAKCSALHCKLSEMELISDNITMAGDLSVDTHNSRPYIVANLKTDMLDLSPFLGKEKAGLSLIRSAFAETARWSSEPFALDALKTVDGNFHITANELIANQFKLGNIVLRAKIERGNLSADLLNLSAYSGKANVVANLTSLGVLDSRMDFEDIQLKPLLDATNPDNKISGKASGKMNLMGLATSEQKLVSTLRGAGNISIADGSIKGVDIAGMIRNVQSAYKDVDTTQKSTDFSEVNASYNIENGIISNNDLIMKAPLFRVSGKGTVNLPAYSINYRLTPEVVETIQGQGGKDKTGVSVPILVTGSLDKPRYAPDLKGLAEDALKDPEKLKNTVNSIKDLIKKPKAAPTDPNAVPATDGSAAPAPTQEKPMNQLKDLLKGF